MRLFHTSILRTVTVASLLLSAGACSDYLEEKNLSSLTDSNYFTSPGSFDALVVGTYNQLRDATRQYQLHFLGTDIITRQGLISGQNPVNDYVNLNAQEGTLVPIWNSYYAIIKNANVVLSRANVVPGLTESAKQLGFAEVKFLRAYSYFTLAVQFGGLPLVLDEVRTATTDFARASEEDVFKQVISDLESAAAVLPAVPTQTGRASKGAVQHLLAKVYLTRGYKPFGTPADFEKARQLADEVIKSGTYSLLPTFAAVTDYNNQVNKEVIFAVQYTSTLTANGAGNDRHQLFKFAYEAYPGMSRTSDYNKAIQDYSPTPYFYSLFSDHDVREAATYSRVIYAVVDNAARGVVKGDTVIYFPKRAWTAAQKAAKKYRVFNPDEYFTPDGTTTSHFPMFRRYDDPSAPYTDTGAPPQGTRDAVLFRLAETYLIAAEAALKAGNASLAADYINPVRQRAAMPGFVSEFTVKPADATINLILEERARELTGEVSRWEDLKRTGTLIERVLAYNPHAQLNKAIDQHNLLRPIPQREIDLTGGKITQNQGY
ncbi:RagB/SusD family nutrient uptake outer membrane protein [Spirosoma soli]|uniref:RagB/SusD family nutrient uptake outer membrane protein n=1 Tax=Spirosoma soli TaxID=1770529 RepID=A0ABW5M8F9_9BACT